MEKLKSGIRTLLVIFILLLGICSNAQDTLKVESKVEKVVVFLKGAQIKRSVKCILKKGENLINFTKLSSQVVEKSIQVNSDSSVVIQSINFQVNYMDSLARIQRISLLQNRIDSLESEKLVLGNTLDVLKNEEELLQENKVLGGEKKTMKTEDLEKACAYYHERILEIINLKVIAQNRLKKIAIEEASINNQLTELNTKKEKPVGEIWIVVYSMEATEKQFIIEYFINDAGWKPKYDIRAESVNKPVELEYKADVYQNTDDDWTNVQLILSSSNPSLEGTKPVLSKWNLDVTESYNNVTNIQDNSNYSNSIGYYQEIKKDYATPINIEEGTVITGTVVDGGDGYPIPGISISVKGFPIGTITDFDGKYTLTLPKSAQTLVISYMGYTTQEISITGTTLTCSMEASEELVDEVVVIGYGTVEKCDATGSITSVSPADFSIEGSLAEALLGKVPGIVVSSNPATFNGSTNFSLRRLGSSGNPLYVVDGIRVEDIDFINTNDVETITILKDASACALYGPGGGNGVIVITTKRGPKYSCGSFNLFENIKERREQKRLTKKTIGGLNQIKENQTSVQFLLDKPYSIPSDNKNYSVDIEKYEIPVNFQYSTIPKMDPSAFLLAQITQWEDLNLLSGNVNIYFEGSYIGSSALDVQKTNDTLDISMGRDKAIVIDRKLKEDFNKKLGKNQKYIWEITVKNTKNDSINVMVEDQIPLSYSKDFEIELLESQNAKYNKEKGELSWTIDLAPLEKKILTFSYMVKSRK